MTNLDLIKGFFDGLRPEPRLTVSEWADKYRMLAATSSAESGPWRTSRTPYLKEIMDNLSAQSTYTEVVVMKGAQVGFTEAGYNWIGYVIDCAPGPMLVLMPTDKTVKRNTKIRFDPMISATPRLYEKIAPAKSRDSGNTLEQKDFPGGTVVMGGANSPASLRSLPVRYLMLDEVDEYPLDLGEQGSPMDLARARTRTFSRRKILIGSTPTMYGSSVVEAEYLKTDQRNYYVPCPECSQEQVLKFEQLRWEKGKPETVLYHCIGCGIAIQERYKTRMLANGIWRPTAPDLVSYDRVGYHISSLYSPYGWYSWQQLVKDYEEAEKDINKKKTFVNTVLGQTYREETEKPHWEMLYNRRGSHQTNRVPLEVAFLTAGVDVQKDRIEIEIVGWAPGKRSYSIDYRILYGDTDRYESWDALADIVEETWKREDGMQMQIRKMCVDSGYNTNMVYDFVRRFDAVKVVATKGSSSDTMTSMFNAPRQVDRTAAGKKIGRMRVTMLGVSIIKKEIYGYLRQQENEDGTFPMGYCFFPGYSEDYFKQLTSESYIREIVNGRERYVWKKENNTRNEALDCRVYARAASAILGMDRWSEEQWQKEASFSRTDKVIRKVRESIWR